MKICVVQPRYSMDGSLVRECFEELISQLSYCDSSLDLIVLPEYSDIPADALARVMTYAPDIPVCVGWDGNCEDKMSIVERAKKIGAKKIQLFKPYFDENTVRAAKDAGILTNVFWSDDEDEAREFRKMGIDTILTNDYLKIKNALEVN